MTANFETALAQTRSGYVVAIGDDDGLMPDSVNQVAHIIRETGYAAVTSSSVYYAWPDYPVESDRDMILIRDVRRGVKTLHAKSEAAKRIRCRGEERDYVWGLPSLYRGFVNTEIIERARKHGRYFHSITPDAYSAFVNSFFIDSYLYSRRPFTIEGVSGKSNGASQLIGRDASEEGKYLVENDIAFIDELVYTPSASIILAEAFLQAKRQFPEHSKDYDFDIEMVCQSARRNARGGNTARVHEAVERILKMHGKQQKKEPLRSLMYRMYRILVDSFVMIEIDCDQAGVKDVYQASILAHRVLQEGKHRNCREGAEVLAGRIVRKLAGSEVRP